MDPLTQLYIYAKRPRVLFDPPNLGTINEVIRLSNELVLDLDISSLYYKTEGELCEMVDGMYDRLEDYHDDARYNEYVERRLY